MMKRLLLIAVLCAVWQPVRAADHPSYDSLSSEITHNPGCVPSDYPNFTMFACKADRAFWYFTKPNNPAHPGVIKRAVIQDDTGVVIHTDGWSFGPEADQPKFQAWLNQFRQLDARMRADMQRRAQQRRQ